MSNITKNKFKIMTDLISIASEFNWRLNPNMSLIQSNLTKQNENLMKYGKAYCPCKKEQIDDNICPCKNAQNEINETGHCHCYLYWNNKIGEIKIEFNIIDKPKEKESMILNGEDNLQFLYLKYKDVKKKVITIENDGLYKFEKINNKIYIVIDNVDPNKKLIEISNLTMEITKGLSEQDSNPYFIEVQKYITQFLQND